MKLMILILSVFKRVPLLKCATYCKLRKKLYNKAISEISSMTGLTALHLFFNPKIDQINTDKYSIKELIDIYRYSKYEGCFQYHSWLQDVRAVLKDEIAERILLEDLD